MCAKRSRRVFASNALGTWNNRKEATVLTCVQRASMDDLVGVSVWKIDEK